MITVTLELQEKAFSVLRQSPEEFVREMHLAAAIHWYGRGEISQEKAAQVAGLNRTNFLFALDPQEGLGTDMAQVEGEDDLPVDVIALECSGQPDCDREFLAFRCTDLAPIVCAGFTCPWEYPARACCDNNVKKFLDISPPE
jgi:hypothetical protein